MEVLDALLKRGDFDLDLKYGRRTGKGELKILGLLVTPGGARGWSVGQKSSEARELEPLLGEIGDQGSRSKPGTVVGPVNLNGTFSNPTRPQPP